MMNALVDPWLFLNRTTTFDTCGGTHRGDPRSIDREQEPGGAERGLAELTRIIDRGDLPAFLSRAWPIGPLDPPAAAPPGRIPVARVPLLSRENRAAWLQRHARAAAP